MCIVNFLISTNCDCKNVLGGKKHGKFKFISRQLTAPYDTNYAVSDIGNKHANEIQWLHYVTQTTDYVSYVANQSKNWTQFCFAIRHCSFENALAPVERCAQLFVTYTYDTSQPFEYRSDNSNYDEIRSKGCRL